MSGGEFSRPVRLDEIGGGITRSIEASEIERAALAKRFGLIAVGALTAELNLTGTAAGTRVSGTVHAKATAACAVSAEPVDQLIAEEVAILVLPDVPRSADEEIELSEGDLDVVLLQGGRIDLGAIAADSFALALNPYPLADETVLAEARKLLLSEEQAEAERQAAKQASSPFAALKTLPETPQKG